MEEKKKLKEWAQKNIILVIVCALVLGVLLGAIIMYFVNAGEKVVSVKGKTITSKDLYNKMKGGYSINLLLEDIDSIILGKKYKLDDEETKEIKDTAERYINANMTYYGFTESELLAQIGFENLDEFIDYLSTDYKRSIYYFEKLEEQLEEGAVKKVYDEKSFGTVDTKHILIKVSEEMTDEKALEISKEIIARLDNGENFDDVAKEYTEKYGENAVTENLGKKGAFDYLDEGYVEGMRGLEKGEYSKEPVQTVYGYHVIYCIDKTEKTEEISRRERMKIIEELAMDIISQDPNLYNKTLIQMREEAKLKFHDKDFEKKYKEYCAAYMEDEQND